MEHWQQQMILFFFEDNGRGHPTCHVFTSHLSVIWWKRGVFKWLDTGCLWMDVYIASTKRFSAAETFHEGTTASKWFCSNLCIGIDDQLAQSVWHKFHWFQWVQVGGGVATTMTRDASVTLTPGIQYSHSMGSSMSLCTVKVNFSKLLLFFRA